MFCPSSGDADSAGDASSNCTGLATSAVCTDAQGPFWRSSRARQAASDRAANSASSSATSASRFSKRFRPSVLRVKLRHRAAWNARRRAHAARYREALADAPLRLPVERPDAHHVYHQFVVQSPRRDAVRDHLARAGVARLVHYQLTLQEVDALRERVVFRDAPERAAEAARTILSLPIYPELPVAHQQQVIEAVLAFH